MVGGTRQSSADTVWEIGFLGLWANVPPGLVRPCSQQFNGDGPTRVVTAFSACCMPLLRGPWSEQDGAWWVPIGDKSVTSPEARVAQLCSARHWILRAPSARDRGPFLKGDNSALRKDNGAQPR